MDNSFLTKKLQNWGAGVDVNDKEPKKQTNKTKTL